MICKNCHTVGYIFFLKKKNVLSHGALDLLDLRSESMEELVLALDGILY